MSKKIEKSVLKSLNPRLKEMFFEPFNSNDFVRQRPPLHDVFSLVCDRYGFITCNLGVGVPIISAEIRGDKTYPHVLFWNSLGKMAKGPPRRWYATQDESTVVDEIWSEFVRAEPWYERWTSLEQFAEFERRSFSLYRDGSDGQQHCYLKMAEIYAVMGDSVRVTEALRPLEDLLIEYRKSPKKNRFAIDFYEPKVMAVKSYLAKNSHERS
jgi:hypothetical protein